MNATATLLVLASLSSGIQLDGLDPQRYMQRRNHVPDVSGELSQRPIDDVLLVLRDDAAIAWPKDTAYPATLKSSERAAIRQKERRAVKLGALFVLAKSGDARAEGAIIAALDDVDELVAASAAERLGDARGERGLATLSGIVVDDARSLSVRAGACAGLARLRSEASRDVLLNVIGADVDDALKLHALEAMETLLSRWAFEARGEAALGAALRSSTAKALSGLALSEAVAARRDLAIKRLQ